MYGSIRNWQSIKLCLGLGSLWRTVLGVSEQSFDSNTCSRVSNFWNCSSECDNYCRSSFRLCDHFVRSISPRFLKSRVPLKSYVILEYFALVLLVISVSPFLNCKICPWKVFIFWQLWRVKFWIKKLSCKKKKRIKATIKTANKNFWRQRCYFLALYA